MLLARWSLPPARLPQLLRETAVGGGVRSLDVPHSPLHLICIAISGEMHRYQVVKRGLPVASLLAVPLSRQAFRIEFQWEVLLHPSGGCSGSELAPVPWVFLLFKVAAVCLVHQPFSSHRGPPMINIIFSWMIDNLSRNHIGQLFQQLWVVPITALWT